MIVNVVGGLGNQMYIYAFAKALDLRYGGGGVELNINSYAQDLQRKFELNKYNISLNIRENFKPKEYFLKHAYFTYKFNVFKNNFRRNRKHCYKYRIYDNDELPNLLKYHQLNKHSYFEGYFQNLAYFDDIFEVIRNEFTLKNKMDAKNEKLREQILGTKDSVFIHIRRGDYLNISEFLQLDYTNYYNNAIKIIKDKVSNPTIFIFSNGIEWCKKHIFTIIDKNLTSNMEFVFIDNNDENNAVYEMEIMRACKNGIIANSTFSQWAGHLINFENKVIVAPSKFFTTDTMKHNNQKYLSKVYPHSWMIADI